MGKKEIYMEKVIFIIKCMLGAYILTAGLLLLLAFMRVGCIYPTLHSAASLTAGRGFRCSRITGCYRP